MRAARTDPELHSRPDPAKGGLARIVITHHHLDHVGSVATIAAHLAQVFAHPGRGFHPGDSRAASGAGRARACPFRLLAPVCPELPVPVAVTVQDGDGLDLLSGATVLHVPGHRRAR
jgi:glyoxylase-like metal-dependent hydrolase (beta-lactamase superfamily II)